RKVEADPGLLEEHLEAGQAVAGGARDDPAGTPFAEELAVREVRRIAPEVEVEPAGPGDRPGHPVLHGERRGEHAHALRPPLEDLVADDERLDLRQPGTRG